MLLATVNEALLLSMVAADGRTDLYGRAHIYDGASLIASVNLNHVAEGLYSNSYTPASEGYYSVVYDLFFDVSRSISAGYEKQGEALDVNSFRTNILRILGLHHENTVVDQQTYDSDQNLTSARIRCYDNAADAVAAAGISPAPYPTGLRFIYNLSANYSSGLLDRYYVTRLQ